MTVVETERLALRAFTADDADFVLRIVNEPSFLRYIGDRGVRNLDDARKYIADGPVAGYARDGHGLMRVDRKSDGASLGMCGLLKREALPEPDIGFSFFPEYWSQGYALESARAVLGHARGTLGIGRILAITTRDNASSMRLLDKLGFRFERMIAFGNEELRLFASDP
ncbi:MAG TPA: GNAT family N-acetyltransferase [Steroidobacteraceae bacterium]|jgi:RimJ/RimL family protein N-acetyltransferase|nr:GNAT family N-acetyltransferase [Steroidobacteraceae bacterium]